MIRIYSQTHKGATTFSEIVRFSMSFIKLLISNMNGQCKVLFHSCSIGAEPYSFAMMLKYKYKIDEQVKIYATDINPDFLEIAKCGEYSADVLNGMTPDGRPYFDVDIKNNVANIPREIMDMVEFLPPMNFVTDVPDEIYDAVLIMNSLTYVSPREQSMALRSAEKYTSKILCLTAFHPDSIKPDIESIGFFPYCANIKKIHYGWAEKITDKDIDPASPGYSWRLPLYSAEVVDYKFKFCSLFIRR